MFRLSVVLYDENLDSDFFFFANFLRCFGIFSISSRTQTPCCTGYFGLFRSCNHMISTKPPILNLSFLPFLFPSVVTYFRNYEGRLSFFPFPQFSLSWALSCYSCVLAFFPWGGWDPFSFPESCLFVLIFPFFFFALFRPEFLWPCQSSLHYPLCFDFFRSRD